MAKPYWLAFALFALVLFTACQPLATPTPTPLSPPTSTVSSTVTPTTPPTALPKSRVDTLLAQMTLEQKVGQVLMIGIDGPSIDSTVRDEIQALHIGGVILYNRNIQSPQQLAQLDADLQNIVRANKEPGLFISIDQEGGNTARLNEKQGFTEFPSQMAVGATGDVENARRMAQAMAAEMRAVGINMDLTPVLDVNNNPQNPIIGIRSFGSQPQRVAEFGVAFLDGLQTSGIMAVGKHFPGHGDTAVDSHVALPSVPHDRARLQSVEWVPFQAAMKANIAGIMSAHITFPAIDPTPGLAATLSPKVMTGLIRDEMKYDGLLMTDSLVMGALATTGYPPPLAAATALNAGADVLLFQNGYNTHRQAHALIVERVKSGEIPMTRLDQAVRRILLAKERFGLLDAPVIDIAQAASQCGMSATKAISRDIAAQSVTLVRDNANLLPLKLDDQILVVESSSSGLAAALNATGVSFGQNPGPSAISSILTLGKTSRTVIVTTTDVATNRQQADLVKQLLAAKIPTIVVAMRSPYDLLAFSDAPTFLAVYGDVPPSREALVSVLSGKTKPGGKLPVELPGVQ